MNYYLIRHERDYEDSDFSIKKYESEKELLKEIEQNDVENCNVELIIVKGDLYVPKPKEVKIVTEYTLRDCEL
jgi:hypothetical protein